MKSTLIAAALALATVCPLAAQWPNRPSKKAPKTADGKVNFDAPAPRTADGIDRPERRLRKSLVLQRPHRPAAGVKPAGQPPQTTFSEVGAGFKDGLPFQPWARDLYKQRKESNAKRQPRRALPADGTDAVPHPPAAAEDDSRPADEIVILYEGNEGIREIFTDGRPLPKNGDVQPFWYGYSTGHWERDTLVVETNNFRDGGWLDINGSAAYKIRAKLTERFTRLNYGTLRIDVTIDDPKAYTAPFTVRLTQRIVPDGELIEFICAENERSTAHMIGK